MMLRTSSLLIVIASLLATGCAIEPKKQRLFEDATQPPKTATRAWNGEEITITNTGLDPEDELDGVQVMVSASATHVAVEAVFAARADVDKPNNADQAMADVMKSFVLDETPNGFEIRCGQGETHGTARGYHAGCGTLRVTIPAGSPERPHAITVATGSGRVSVGGAEAPFVRSLVVDSRGPSQVDVRVRPVKDARVRVTAGGPVAVALPDAFSAEQVVLDVGITSLPDAVRADFPGMVSGASYPPSGPSPEAATELNVESNAPPRPEVIRIVKL